MRSNKIEVFNSWLSYVWPSPLRLGEVNEIFTYKIRTVTHTHTYTQPIHTNMWWLLHGYMHTYIHNNCLLETIHIFKHTYVTAYIRTYIHVATPTHISTVIWIYTYIYTTITKIHSVVLRMNSTCYFVQIPEAAPYKIAALRKKKRAAVQPLASYLTSKMSMTSRVLL